MKYPSIEIKPAVNGFIVEKSWMEEEHNYQSEKYIFSNWKDACTHILNNPVKFEH